MNFNQKEYESVLLGSLLHDIGKFMQRAGKEGTHPDIGIDFIDEFQDLFPYEWLDDLRDTIGNHHRPARKEVEKIVKLADWFSSGEREQEPGLGQRNPSETPLIATAAKVTLKHKSSDRLYGFPLQSLQLHRDVIFPKPYEDIEVSGEIYSKLWKQFCEDLKKAGKIESISNFVTSLAILRKYTSLMPAATPWEEDEEHRTLPDVSLYDHLKVSCAIASCLYKLFPDHLDSLLMRQRWDEPICLMIRADISGIQSFIYRITQPKAETKGSAKRLRGRSFYLSLLADVIAAWFIRELNLSVANILVCSGGRFDLLIPIDQETKGKLTQLEETLQKFLLKSRFLQGEVGIQVACVEVTPNNFGDLKPVYEALDDDLVKKKQKKFENEIGQEDFFNTGVKLYDICHVCQITELSDEKIGEKVCKLCEIHKHIGEILPKRNYLAYIHDDARGLIPDHEDVLDFTDPFGLTVALLDKDNTERLIDNVRNNATEVILYRINSTDFLFLDLPQKVSCSFKFLGHEAPVALRPLVRHDNKQIDQDDVLDFDDIASMSDGAKLLGVLKADVDNLGLLFRLGIEPKRTISRVSTFSHTLDLFFAGWLNEICQQLTDEWNSAPENVHPFKRKVRSLFYIVYSGGDDLLIIGPWDWMLRLSQRIYTDFREYTCHNSNITLSAGLLQVKPHFPIQRFAQLVNEQLERAKNRGRDRITVFGETVAWSDNYKSFDQLFFFGEQLVTKVENKEIPKSFIYFLLRLHKQYFGEDGSYQLMWIPKFHYTLARRIKKEVIEDKELDLSKKIPAMIEHIGIPVSYVSLKTRKE